MKPIALRAARAGVPIVTGTDVLEAHGEMLLQELETLVGIGMSAREVLLAATVTSADAALRPQVGRVTVGGPASFLVLRANPLDDIKNLRTLSMVVLRGRLLSEAEFRTLRQ
jgi:imidazolonepropionase-like amidohydrolase